MAEKSIKYKEVLEKLANEFITNMKSNLLFAMRARASEVGAKVKPFASTLQQEMDMQIGDDFVLITLPYYATFIEHGVKGRDKTYPSASKSKFKFRDKMPPTRVFTGASGWIARRGIIDRGEIRKKTGKKGKDLSKAVISANKSLAFVIARSIQRKGIPGYHFIEDTMNSGIIDKMVEVLAEHTKKEIIVKIA
jgi:hypothetical protein